MPSRLIVRVVLFALVSTALVAGSALEAVAQKKGGVLKVGNLGEPPTLDVHWTTATITEVLANHIYEGLYSLDAKSQPIPMLAESMPAVSKDGLTYTFKLRQGIKFFAVSLVAFGFTYAVLVGLVSGAGMTKVLAQAIAIAAGTPLNFVGQKLWSFKA